MGKVSDKTAKLQALWRMALREGEVKIPLTSAAELHRCRFALYDSVKRVRKGEEIDPELLEATTKVVIQIRGLTLVLTTQAEKGILNTIDALLEGKEDLIKEDGPKDVLDAEAEASAKRLMERLQQETGADPSAIRIQTPYDREL